MFLSSFACCVSTPGKLTYTPILTPPATHGFSRSILAGEKKKNDEKQHQQLQQSLAAVRTLAPLAPLDGDGENSLAANGKDGHTTASHHHTRDKTAAGTDAIANKYAALYPQLPMSAPMDTPLGGAAATTSSSMSSDPGRTKASSTHPLTQTPPGEQPSTASPVQVQHALHGAAFRHMETFIYSLFPGTFSGDDPTSAFMREASHKQKVLTLFHQGTAFQRASMALLLLSNVTFSAVVITIMMDVQYPSDDKSCNLHTSESTCLLPMSMFDGVAHKCHWDPDRGGGICAWQVRLSPRHCRCHPL